MSSSTKAGTAMKDPVKCLEAKFDECMQSFEVKLSAAKLTTVQELAAEFKLFKCTMLTALQTLKEQIASLNQITDELDNRSRQKFLIFRGVTEREHEKLPSLIHSIVTDSMKISANDFKLDNIKTCYRIGSSNDTNRPRPILVKFCDLSCRKKIWQSKRNLKGSNVSIAEFLTPRSRDIFIKARAALGMKHSWTLDGNIYIKDTSGSKHRISSLQQLADFLQKNAPLDEGCKSAREPRTTRNKK